MITNVFCYRNMSNWDVSCTVVYRQENWKKLLPCWNYFRSKERFCPHCNEYVSKATFFRHRLFYYDHLANLNTSLICILQQMELRNGKFIENSCMFSL